MKNHEKGQNPEEPLDVEIAWAELHIRNTPGIPVGSDSMERLAEFVREEAAADEEEIEAEAERHEAAAQDLGQNNEGWPS